MLRVFYNMGEAKSFAEKTERNGGTASIRKPYGEHDAYTEVVWTHDKNKEVKQVIFGYPCRYEVVETIRREDFPDDRTYNRYCEEKFRACLHERETPESGKKAYLISY